MIRRLTYWLGLFLRPRIDDLSIDHVMYGVGQFTQVTVAVRGWGYFRASSPVNTHYSKYSQWLPYSHHKLVLIVPLGCQLRVFALNCCGYSRLVSALPLRNIDAEPIRISTEFTFEVPMATRALAQERSNSINQRFKLFSQRLRRMVKPTSTLPQFVNSPEEAFAETLCDSSLRRIAYRKFRPQIKAD